MLHISKAITYAQNNKPHDFKFVSKGTGKKNRTGGYVVEMKNAVVTSSNYERRKMNIKSLDSGQVRWCYYVLLIEIDGHEVIL